MDPSTSSASGFPQLHPTALIFQQGAFRQEQIRHSVEGSATGAGREGNGNGVAIGRRDAYSVDRLRREASGLGIVLVRDGGDEFGLEVARIDNASEGQLRRHLSGAGGSSCRDGSLLCLVIELAQDRKCNGRENHENDDHDYDFYQGVASINRSRFRLTPLGGRQRVSSDAHVIR